ncbi:zinc finger CCHC-type and RNA-binding motif-containing protein 1-like [Prunus dulcis]|nr:zinc finger CCHC-type and RNA-binding motif-containing protein 1-like [Prunus dulcis]
MEKKGSKDSLKCFECGGYGHFTFECANNLRKQNSGKNKVMAATWSDSESDNDSSSENEDQVIAFSRRIHAQKDENFDVEEPEIEMVMKQFNNPYDSSKKLKKKNAEFADQVVFLQEELTRTEAAFQSQLKTEENLRGSLLEKIQMLQDKY